MWSACTSFFYDQGGGSVLSNINTMSATKIRTFLVNPCVRNTFGVFGHCFGEPVRKATSLNFD